MAKKKKTQNPDETKTETAEHIVNVGWKKIHPVLPLLILCVAALLVVGGVYALTKQAIADHASTARQETAMHLFPDATEIVFLYETEDGAVYAAEQNGVLLGLCVSGREKVQGGIVEVMKAVYPDASTGGIQIVQATDVPWNGQIHASDIPTWNVDTTTLDFSEIAVAHGWKLPEIRENTPEIPEEDVNDVEEGATGSIVFVDDFPDETEKESDTPPTPPDSSSLTQSSGIKTVVVSSVPRVTLAGRLSGENRVIVTDREVVRVTETEETESIPPEIIPETEPETMPETETETMPETIPETESETTPEPIPETEPDTTPDTDPETSVSEPDQNEADAGTSYLPDVLPGEDETGIPDETAPWIEETMEPEISE